MGDKGHFITSLFKSGIRIVGYTLVMMQIPVLTLAMSILIIAEIFGVVEEFADKR